MTTSKIAFSNPLDKRAWASFQAVVPSWKEWLGTTPSFGPAVSPLTGTALPSPPATTPEMLKEVLKQSRDARWASLPVRQRLTYLRRFKALMWKRQAQILDVLQWETGKARSQAFDELLDVSANTSFLSASANRVLKPRRHPGAFPLVTHAKTSFVPYGTVGVIAPWNYPFTLAFSDAAAALAAGNQVVLKPASATPLTAIMVAALLEAAGLPRNVFQVVFGSGSLVGTWLVEQADYIMFTGSSAVGKQIAAVCGKRLIGFSAELGGKNPSIVLPGTDLGVWAKRAVNELFPNSGQLCVSIERVYVPQNVFAQAVGKLKASTAVLQGGRSFSWGEDYGPLISADHAQKVSRFVEQAVATGAKVVIGGDFDARLGPSGYSPTLLTHVGPEARLFAEETFGPIVALYPYQDVQEAIRLANHSTYGLHASVWGPSVKEAAAVAAFLRVGSVSLNGDFRATWGAASAPIGGMKGSGTGRRHGVEGIMKFTQTQTVATAPRAGMGPWFGMNAKTWARLEEWVVRGNRVGS